MKNGRKIVLPALWIIVLFLMTPLFAALPSAQDITSEGGSKESTEIIVPGPQDIKEATGIALFLSWIWLSILVLVYFLRLKIKESDRLYRLGYFREDGSSPTRE